MDDGGGLRRDHARETTGDTADPVGDAGEELESLMALALGRARHCLESGAWESHRFQRLNGRWPERLMEVGGVTVQGTEWIDPMDGRSLRYQALPEGEGFLLYSVGTDGRDDGGSVKPENEHELDRTLFNGEDWVWPRKAR